jgi:hypothetical protein
MILVIFSQYLNTLGKIWLNKEDDIWDAYLEEEEEEEEEEKK